MCFKRGAGEACAPVSSSGPPVQKTLAPFAVEPRARWLRIAIVTLPPRSRGCSCSRGSPDVRCLKREVGLPRKIRTPIPGASPFGFVASSRRPLSGGVLRDLPNLIAQLPFGVPQIMGRLHTKPEASAVAAKSAKAHSHLW